MNGKMKIMLCAAFSLLSMQALKADMRDEASVSAATLISKANSIASSFVAPQNVTAALTNLSALPDLQSPAAQTALQKVGVSDKASSFAKLVQPYEQQKTTSSIQTWIKNYRENKQFYTTPDQQQQLIDLKDRLETIINAEDSARRLHIILMQRLKN